MFLNTVKIDRKYCAPSSAKLYTVICQIDRSFGVIKRANADILLFQSKFVDPKHS